MQTKKLRTVYRLQKDAISAALPLLQANREVLLSSHSRIDRKSRRRVLDRGIKPIIAKYDAAIESCNQALEPGE